MTLARPGFGQRPKAKDQGPALPPTSKETLQYLRATACQNASADFHAVVQAGMVQDLHHRMDGARFGVIRAVDQTFQPGVNHSAGAHRTRLNCNKEFAVFQPVVAQRGTGLAQGEDLGVSGGVAVGKVAVTAAAYDFSAADHDGAYRDLSRFERSLGGAQRIFHKEFVGFCFGIGRRVHSRTYSAGRCASMDASSCKSGRTGWFTKMYFPALSASR